MMTDSDVSYTPLGWDERKSRTATRYLGIYWKNVAICVLALSTTVLFTKLLDRRTESNINGTSYCMLPLLQIYSWVHKLTC